MEKVYISGPMSGVARADYLRAFGQAERALGHFYGRVVNPARLAPSRWPWLYRLVGYRLTLAYDLWHLRRCQAIALLPGYRHSRGARLELLTARRRGMKVIYL